MSDEKTAYAPQEVPNEALAAQYPAPSNEPAYPQPATYTEQPANYATYTTPQPVVQQVVVAGPYVSAPQELPQVASPNKVLDWMTSAGATKGLCIGYATISLLSFITMCIAASANGTVWGGFGWQIFNGLQGWLYAATLAVMWGYKPFYDIVMKMWGNTSKVVVQWVWIAVNGVQVIWSLAALGQIGAWGTCGTYWWGDYLGSWGNVCAKSSAVLAFDVFLFLAWLASLTVALLEKFAPKYVGSPIGWKNAKADEGVKVAMAPVEQV